MATASREELFPPTEAVTRYQNAGDVFRELDAMDDALRLDALRSRQESEDAPCGAVVACWIARRLGLEADAHGEYFARLGVYEAYAEMLEIGQLPVQDRYRDMAERTGADGRASSSR